MKTINVIFGILSFLCAGLLIFWGLTFLVEGIGFHTPWEDSKMVLCLESILSGLLVAWLALSLVFNRRYQAIIRICALLASILNVLFGFMLLVFALYLYRQSFPFWGAIGISTSLIIVITMVLVIRNLFRPDKEGKEAGQI